MTSALLPGTFDPPSLGHLDLIERASRLCDVLYIGVATNISKGNILFTTDERVALLTQITGTLPNVKVVTFEGLVIDYAKANEISFLIRGLRAFSDFEAEFRMALANRKMSGLETLFLMSDEKHAHISSTLIKEIAKFGRHVTEFVPAAIEPLVYQRLSGK